MRNQERMTPEGALRLIVKCLPESPFKETANRVVEEAVHLIGEQEKRISFLVEENAALTCGPYSSRWFLLYGGSSPDGLGVGRYVGRTIDPRVASAHFRKCKADPYSTGYVKIVQDENIETAMSSDAIDPFKYKAGKL